ncbi:Phosphatidylserine decarboxylase proenzyme 3 [Grifola frondosa]|uniref:Phosphatidylserine decarboxylase proenzyme 3 n=1 Tax=Grifola frondosa TaxID=5627 RepID=A0A1C7LSU7_GRIFR|nr:Phosphatidylserine decarboxylase proenzyme 3 [Grifola frondosa]
MCFDVTLVHSVTIGSPHFYAALMCNDHSSGLDYNDRARCREKRLNVPDMLFTLLFADLRHWLGPHDVTATAHIPSVIPFLSHKRVPSHLSVPYRNFPLPGHSQNSGLLSMSYRKTTLTRYAGWLPANPAIQRSFIGKYAELIRTPYGRRAAHVAPVAKFENAIKSDPTMVDLFNQIFLQVSDENQVKDFDSLLYMLDIIVVQPPKYHIAKDESGNVIGEPIGVPVYLLFDLLSNTSAAYDLFRKPAFNAALKDLLDSWGQYLTTEDSNSSLNDQDEGWFSDLALTSLEEGRGIFNETYDHDQFWLKGQAYSLYDMLNRDDEFAKQFVGGTVYQAFLSPLDYHRWRSPVDGTIAKVVVVPGTYYAVLPDAGAEVGDPDLKPGDPHGALIRSQGWITLSAARALIFIQADNPDIGLVGFIGVGMAEVSTCEVTVVDGQKVATGDELGMFRFGGSSHTLIFGPQTKVTFPDSVVVDQHLWVNSIIAQASKA